MDPFTLTKFGDVTIQRIPPKSDDTKAKPNEPAQNNIPPPIQLPKLPPSINITIKSNTNVSTSVSETEPKYVRSNEVKRSDNFILSREVELKKREAKPSDINDKTEYNDNVDNLKFKLNEQDTGVNVCDNEKTESDVDCAESDQKMKFDTNPESRSDSSEEELQKGELPEDSEFAEPNTLDEFPENDCVQDDLTDLPAIPIDEFVADELPDDIKEEQFSDKETSESDDADDEFDNEAENPVVKKKKKRKPKVEDEFDNDSGEMKKQKTSLEDEDSADENVEHPKSELKLGNMRRNIREVMDETKLEEATLAAQRQEMERLRRVQEQQRIIREVQRQIALNRQNNKMQARVLSLLQKGTTSIIKTEEEEKEDEQEDRGEEEGEEDEEIVEEKKPNTVLVKLSTGSGPPQIVNKKVLDLLKQNSTLEEDEDNVAKEKLVNLSKNLDKPQMMTASVSIAPVKHESKLKEIVSEKEEEEDKPRSKDVVMISSSSGEEDDCIVISEEESEPEEDTTNSGMHTNDLYNVPDEQGRVLINVGHPDFEKDVFLAPQIARIIKPHQIGGVRFLFDNIVESLDRYKTSEGFGCILAHSMGLGKTLQVVSFCDVFLRYTEGKTVLCIMPINTLQNWMAEFNMWLPTDPDSSPLKEQGEMSARQFPIFVLNDNQKTLSARANVIQNWNREGGVLLIGYELYRQLSLKKPPKSRTRSKRKTEAEEDLEDEKCKNLLDNMYNALVKPGPDLVICDEGHRIKNSHASISQALKQIRSKRRVVLTGYPLQNNLLEYWCMVDFVRPNYLGTKTEFSNMFERPIQNGQCIDSTPQDIKLMRYRAHVLHSLLEGFVQRRSHSVLQQTLPNKYEFVLLLRLTPLQRELYNTFMNEVVRTKAVPNPLKAFAVCCKIWNHPDILYNFLKKRAGDEELDLDIDEASTSIGTPVSGPSTPVTPSTPPHQANKRTRSGRGKAQGKEAKLPRKNARTSTPQPINKTPSIAAVPPNTANSAKTVSPEQAITNTNNQPIPPFHSYNNQFQNFNQQNENFNEFSQSGSSNQNYNNQYGQEYNSSAVPNNPEFNSSTSYQQNYSENNYFQSEFNQNNYWQGNNENGNFYNNNMSAPTEEYYQQNSSSSNSQYSGSEYNTNSENVAGNFNNSNYNYEINSPMNYPNQFTVKQEANVSQFGVNDNEMLLEGNNDVYSDMPNDEMNFRSNQVDMCDSGNLPHFSGQGVTVTKSGVDNASIINNTGEQTARQNLPPFTVGNRNMSQMNPRLGLGNQNVPFNTFNSGSKGAVRMPTRSPIRSGAVGRPRKDANFRPGTSNDEKDFLKFKPGLPGGAPIMKTGLNEDQSFQNVSMDGQAAHVLGSQISPEELNVYAQNQVGANFMDTLRSEELWNPNTVDQNTLFQDPNFIYEESGQIPNNPSSFIGNEASSLLGGVRATSGLLNEIQNNEGIFSGVQQGYTQSSLPEQNLFNLDNFGYLNDLQNSNYQMSSHTTFMGLLEGEDGVQMNQTTATEANPDSNRFGVQSGVDNPLNENFIGTNLPFQTTEPATGRSSTEINAGRNVDILPVKKDVDHSIRGLARSGQISLKVVEKKNESQTKLIDTNTTELPKSKTSAGVTSATNSSQTNFQSTQNRLPSIDIFNTSQNFVSSERLNQETGNYPQIRQFAYGESQTVSTGSNTANWEGFERSGSNDFNTHEKPFFNQAQVTRGGKTPVQNIKKEVTDNSQMQISFNDNQTFKKDGFSGSFTNNSVNETAKDDSRNRFPPTVEPKKDEKLNKNLFPPQSVAPPPSSPKVENTNAANKPQPKMNPLSAISAKIAEKKQQQLKRSNPPNRMELSKQFQQKSETATNMLERESQKSQFPSGVNTKPVLPLSQVKSEPKEAKSEDLESDDVKMPAPEVPILNRSGKEEPGIPYDWTNEFFKEYDPGKIEASAKTLIFFCMLEEIIQLGDRLLLFSQSLFTLDLIEDFLHMYNIPGTEEKWARNKSYFRLDGSTSALEREKLINEFNSNPSVHLFLVSTRAGSLGINLVGANRVVVFDASWNPCHDTQAVCRVYRYGQQKPCYVYRFVMDNCLEKKIYDRQINKQGMSDRVVDECNPDAHLTIKDVSNLCWDTEDVSDNKRDFREYKDRYNDVVIQTVIEKHSSCLSKEPFQHESLLVDRKDKQLSTAEKRMAKRSYELEKQASLKPAYGFYNNPHTVQNRTPDYRMGKPMASVRPMQVDNTHAPREGARRWIPAEVWQKQGMSAQEMTLPLDIVIPTNTSDSRSSIVLKGGQKVMVLKSPKGIYMQLENGKIIAIKTAMKNAPGNGKPGIPRSMPGNSGGIKMLPRPSIERPMTSMAGRRDVTVSPMRSRFVGSMRANPNIPIPGMRPGFSRSPRPGQPIVRTFPLPRPQGRPMRQPLPPTKQIFGPNSSVTISLANKKKMENQEHPHLTEVNYEDYNNMGRLKDMQNLQLNRKLEEEAKNEQSLDRRIQYGDYRDAEDAMNSRVVESAGNFSRIAENPRSSSFAGDMGLKMNTQVVNRFAEPVAKPKIPDIIPESLRFKKDINLTPVRPAAAMKNEERMNIPVKSVAPEMVRKMNPGAFQGQPHFQQQKQLGPKVPNSAQFNLAASSNARRREGVATKSEPVRGKVIKETSAVNLQEVLGKKDVQLSSIKGDATKLNSHSISIFPISKKQEEESRTEAQGQFEDNMQNQNYQKSNFYGQYRDFPAESSQFSNPYDVYKPNYSSNFPQQQEYQSQHSYGSSQYSSVPYPSHDYSSSSFSGEEPQYGTMFANQTPTSSGSFSSYDQYGNYFNAQNYQSKAESSQHSPIQTPASSQPPSQ